ncbi:hypothetical protein RvY_03475 [Ramazzottius varieornatus]|uniref:Uncharacterized protein n=1 Tax=Ramazzottius varieornatus TaxID=947166 RepID=A0A1D1UN74_RAMVA|nr:hypothetical protein RvY_03475 [Ramazzottius varieornatus]
MVSKSRHSTNQIDPVQHSTSTAAHTVQKNLPKIHWSFKNSRLAENGKTDQPSVISKTAKLAINNECRWARNCRSVATAISTIRFPPTVNTVNMIKSIPTGTA